MKSINKLVMVVGVALVLFACQLGATDRVINVSTVDQLYSAVNNAANEGVYVLLAPGTYVLSATNSQGETRPNDGALRLRPGMSLVGDEGRIDSNFDGIPEPISPTTPDNFTVAGTETKIDGSGLTLTPKRRRDCGSIIRFFPDPMIAISRNNLISSLSLFGGDNIAIGEPANAIDSAQNMSAQVVNTVLEGSGFAMTFSNSGCDASHARSVLIFSKNVVRNAAGNGLALFNFMTGNEANDTSNGPEIKVIATNNLFYNNERGILARAGDEGADGGLITLEMTGNVFRNNGTNLFAIAAVGREPSPAVGNRLHVVSRFDTFGESAGPSILLVGGALFFEDAGEPMHTRLDAEFFHSNFVRDTAANPDTPEISIDSGGGSDNHVKVLIRQATVKTSTGTPIIGKLLIQDGEAIGSAPNTARLKGSREDFLQLNQGFRAPPPRFFLIK